MREHAKPKNLINLLIKEKEILKPINTFNHSVLNLFCILFILHSHMAKR